MDMSLNTPSTSPVKPPSADSKELPAYSTLKKSLSGAGLEARPLLPRKRSQSDSWCQSPIGFRHDGDVINTHCWQCGAAVRCQMVPYQEHPPPPSPTFRVPLLSQQGPVEAQQPLVFANNPPYTPSKSDSTSSISQTDKLMRMKDAMLDATDIPVIALWHDETLAVPNQAVARIMHFDTDPVSDAADDVLSRYRIFTEDFEQEFDQNDFPLVKLCRTRQPFSGIRIGIMDSQNRQKVYEVVGQCVYDEKTGDFQAAVCALKDVTWYTELLKVQSEQNEQNEQQFQLICETLPQIVCNLS